MKRTIRLILALFLLGGLAACASPVGSDYGYGHFAGFPNRHGHR